MKINDYFYPMVRTFKLLKKGDCFVMHDMVCMKVNTREEGDHPTNAVILGDGTAIHVLPEVEVFVAEVVAYTTLVKEDREWLHNEAKKIAEANGIGVTN